MRLDLELLAGIVDVEVQAAPLEGVAHLPGVVGGQEDQGLLVARRDGSDLGDGHLEVREHLEQEGLELGIRLVHLVHEQQRSASSDVIAFISGRGTMKLSEKKTLSSCPTRSAASRSVFAPAMASVKRSLRIWV